MTENIYIFQLIAILVFTLLLSFAEKIVFRLILPKVKASSRIWDDALLHAIHVPLKVGIWLSWPILSISVLEEKLIHMQLLAVPLSKPLHQIAMALLLTWCCLRFIHRLEFRYSIDPTICRDPTTAHGIAYLLKIVVCAFSALAVLQFLGTPLSGMIAFGGFGGIAVGFAAKDLLSNLFGGLMIFLDRQFQIGDWIRSPDKEIEGTVEHIGWRITQIRTLDKRPLFVPNSLFSTIALENASRMSRRRIKTTVGFNYHDFPRLEAALADIEKMMKRHPGIDAESTCFVNVVDFTPYYVEAIIYGFTKATDQIEFHAVRQDILLKALTIIREHQLAVSVQSICSASRPD